MTTVYASLDDFVTRYPKTNISSVDITSHFIPAAAVRLDGALAQGFTTPFSSNNETVKWLNVDMAYLIILQRTRRPKEDYGHLGEDINKQIEQLLSGQQAMITTTGDQLYTDASGAIGWSDTSDYKPAFDMRDSIYQRVDPDRLQDEHDEDV